MSRKEICQADERFRSSDLNEIVSVILKMLNFSHLKHKTQHSHFYINNCTIPRILRQWSRHLLKSIADVESIEKSQPILEPEKIKCPVINAIGRIAGNVQVGNCATETEIQYISCCMAAEYFWHNRNGGNEKIFDPKHTKWINKHCLFFKIEKM